MCPSWAFISLPTQVEVVFIGPTATLALGRSCYGPFDDVDPYLSLKNIWTCEAILC